MKKFTLTLLLIFGTVSALFAQQSVREDIFAFLKREGYVPTFDEDRDILFKVQGINSVSYTHLTLPTILRV